MRAVRATGQDVVFVVPVLPLFADVARVLGALTEAIWEDEARLRQPRRNAAGDSPRQA
jgi:hypothetical protein